MYLDSFVKQDKPGPFAPLRAGTRTCFQKNIVYLDLLPARNKPCTATLVMLKQLCTRINSYRQAKTTPYPPCLPAAVRQACTVAVSRLIPMNRDCPDAASGNTTSPYYRAVSLKIKKSYPQDNLIANFLVPLIVSNDTIIHKPI